MTHWQMMFRASTFSVVTATATLLLLGSGQSTTRTTAIHCSAWTTPVRAGADAGVYAEISNPGSTPDRLLDVTCDGARDMKIHRGIQESGVTWTEPVNNVSIPAGSTLEFKPGGSHELFLTGAEKGFDSGQAIRLQFVFEKAGVVTSEVRIRER